MLSQKVQELELENKRLVMIIEDITKSDVAKPKNCGNCKYYRQHYCRDRYGTYYGVYSGFCDCNVPVKRRRGKTKPTPEDTCLCYEEKDI